MVFADPIPKLRVSRRLCPVETWLWLCRQLRIRDQRPFIFLIEGDRLYHAFVERVMSYPEQWPPVPANPRRLEDFEGKIL